MSSAAPQRNSGIDLLRIVSMLLVIVLHCLGIGGAGEYAPPHTVQNGILWLLTAACYGAANLYALTGGYVGICAKQRGERLLELWLQVFLYSVTIFAIERLRGGGAPFSWKQLVSLLLPVTTNRYWYFSAYFFLYALLPFLNPFLQRLEKKRFRLLLAVLFALFCFGGWFSDRMEAFAFSTDGGYSPVWLIALYCAGAYLRRFEEKPDKRKKYLALGGYALFTLLTWGSMLLIDLASDLLLGRQIAKRTMFYSYLSPTVTLASVCLFFFFSQLEIRRGKKLLTGISATTFGIYLIHTHPDFSARYLDNFFLKFTDCSFVGFLALILLYALLLFAFCAAVDYARLTVFRIVNVRKLTTRIVEKVLSFKFYLPNA